MATAQARPLFQQTDEAAIDFMRRMMAWVNTEPESTLQDLPSAQAIVDFFDLWKVYDVDGIDAIIEQIEEGADPAPYDRFVYKYGLDELPEGAWRTFGTEKESERAVYVDAVTARLREATQEYYTSVLIEPTEDGRRLTQLVIDVTDFAAEVMERPEPEWDGSPPTGQYWGLY